MQLSCVKSLSNLPKLWRASSGSPHFSDFGNETCARGGSDLSMKWQCLEVYYWTPVWELDTSCDLTITTIFISKTCLIKTWSQH